MNASRELATKVERFVSRQDGISDASAWVNGDTISVEVENDD